MTVVNGVSTDGEGNHCIYFHGIITADSRMSKTFELIKRVSATSSTVLILGESGTGKELVARAIHKLSKSSGNFVPVNCGAIPDNLLESELFGYEKGAFTGATSSKPGRFALAEGGTIFLDEIGEMSPNLQVKLLRVLQEKTVEPIGGVKSRPVNLRVIAATNVDLRQKVRQGTFREDLFYRLQVVPIELPSLRTRKADVPMLAKHFSRRISERIGQDAITFTDECMEIMRSYPWPGNVRELENLIERLTILVDSPLVQPEDLPDHFFEKPMLLGVSSLDLKLGDDGVCFNSLVEEFENNLILQALERTGGNKKAAARLLQLNRTTLVEKIKKKGLDSSLGGNDCNGVDDEAMLPSS